MEIFPMGSQERLSMQDTLTDKGWSTRLLGRNRSHPVVGMLSWSRNGLLSKSAFQKQSVLTRFLMDSSIIHRAPVEKGDRFISNLSPFHISLLLVLLESRWPSSLRLRASSEHTSATFRNDRSCVRAPRAREAARLPSCRSGMWRKRGGRALAFARDFGRSQSPGQEE